jgi:phosphoribosylcarboxyaminoimidazole (NCAIR) mutase
MGKEAKRSTVAVVMGSDSDLGVMQICIDQLKDFGIDPVVRILSAHRTPEQAGQFAAGAAEGPMGLDALLSTVQMPPGIPVASMAIGKAGAKNAAVFAVQILALGDPTLADKLEQFRRDQSDKALKKDAALQG